MKKISYTSLLTTTILTSMVGGMSHVYAAEAGNTTTDATATIVAGDDNQDPTPPIVDPTDPDDETGQQGPLTLDYASHFEFGEIKLSNQAIEKTPVNKIEDGNGGEVAPTFGAQVTDTRGTGAGWNLTVGLSAFKGTTDTTHELRGAQLELPAGTAVSSDETAEETTKPTTQAVTLDAGASAQSLFTAGENQGMGSWFDKLSADQIKLKAPSAQYADSYKATLTWSLQDAPA
ncbi:WxL domain-containing protein [Enterococcus faecalis]